MAAAAETAIAKRTAIEVASRPQDKKALIDLAHLPGTGQHTTPVDDRSEAIGRVVFFDQQFRGELAGTVKRASACRREILGDALLRPPGTACSERESQAISDAPQRQSTQCRD